MTKVKNIKLVDEENSSLDAWPQTKHDIILPKQNKERLEPQKKEEQRSFLSFVNEAFSEKKTDDKVEWLTPDPAADSSKNYPLCKQEKPIELNVFTKSSNSSLLKELVFIGSEIELPIVLNIAGYDIEKVLAEILPKERPSFINFESLFADGLSEGYLYLDYSEVHSKEADLAAGELRSTYSETVETALNKEDPVSLFAGLRSDFTREISKSLINMRVEDRKIKANQKVFSTESHNSLVFCKGNMFLTNISSEVELSRFKDVVLTTADLDRKMVLVLERLNGPATYQRIAVVRNIVVSLFSNGWGGKSSLKGIVSSRKEPEGPVELIDLLYNGHRSFDLSTERGWKLLVAQTSEENQTWQEMTQASFIITATRLANLDSLVSSIDDKNLAAIRLRSFLVYLGKVNRPLAESFLNGLEP